MTDDVRIIHGDCLEVLPTLEAGSVDAVVTDPPYGIAYQSARRTDKTARLAKIANDESPYTEWLANAFFVAKQCSPLLCFCAWKTQESFRLAIKDAGFTVRSHVIWDRDSHGMGDLNGEFAPQHDIIWFATKGLFKFPGERPKSVLRHTRINGSNLKHPNEKPLRLIADLIRSTTNPGDLVLDPFAGSGTTAVACIKTGRRCIAIEKEARYVEIIRRRVAEAATPLFDALEPAAPTAGEAGR